MRPTGVTPRPILINGWQRKAGRSAVLQHLQGLTRELAAVQAELHGQLTSPMAGKPSSFFEDADAMQALNHLKAELDQLRRIVWFYLEQAQTQAQAAEKFPAGTGQEVQPQRRERATGQEKALVAQAGASSSGAEPGWFFDRLNLVIDSYIQPKKPAAAEAKSAPRADTKAFL
jgi:hypothetical protein